MVDEILYGTLQLKNKHTVLEVTLSISNFKIQIHYCSIVTQSLFPLNFKYLCSVVKIQK